MERRNFNDFENLLKEKGFRILESEKKVNGSGTIVCEKCGCKFSYSHLRYFENSKYSCPGCGNMAFSKKFSFQTIQSKLNAKYPNKFLIVDPRINDAITINSKTKILVKQLDCPHEPWMTNWDRLKQGNFCPKCGVEKSRQANLLSIEEIKKKLVDPIYKDYEFLNLEEFQSVHVKNMKVKHKKCGRVFLTRLRNILYNKNLCPFCEESRIEKDIESYLLENNFQFKREVKFDGLIGKRNQLKFDFLIDKKDFLLEYNGEFHYMKIPKVSEEHFQNQKNNDKKKEEYCINNKLNLLVIPYQYSSSEVLKILKLLLYDDDFEELKNYNITLISKGNYIRKLSI